MKLPRPSKLISRYFGAGILVLIPVLAVLWILNWMFSTLHGFYRLLPESFQTEGKTEFWLTLFATLGLGFILVVGISFLGWISRLYLGQQLLKWVRRLAKKIPLVGTVYTTVEQIVATFSQGTDSKQFSKVVYIEFPRKGLWSVGFVTGHKSSPGLPEGHVHVFVPCSPNPTSGFYLLVPETELRDAHMKVDEAFRTILSLGMARGSPSESSV